MRITLNIISVVLNTVAAMFLLGPYLQSAAYDVFVPAGVDVLFPADSQTIGSILSLYFITFIHVLFLACAILWAPRSCEWQHCLRRWVTYLLALGSSVCLFIAVGFAYRLIPRQKTDIYATDLPVNLCALGILASSVIATMLIRHRYRVRNLTDDAIDGNDNSGQSDS